MPIIIQLKHPNCGLCVDVHNLSPLKLTDPHIQCPCCWGDSVSETCLQPLQRAACWIWGRKRCRIPSCCPDQCSLQDKSIWYLVSISVMILHSTDTVTLNYCIVYSVATSKQYMDQPVALTTTDIKLAAVTCANSGSQVQMLCRLSISFDTLNYRSCF